MAKDVKNHQDMSIEEILKSIKGVIDNRDNILQQQTDEDDVLELTNAVDDHVSQQYNTGLHRKDNRLKKEPEAPILSDDTVLKTSEILKHFSKTAQEMQANNKSKTLEDIVIQMLRPEISKWLEANLPALVKQLVENEIQKLKIHD